MKIEINKRKRSKIKKVFSRSVESEWIFAFVLRISLNDYNPLLLQNLQANRKRKRKGGGKSLFRTRDKIFFFFNYPSLYQIQKLIIFILFFCKDSYFFSLYISRCFFEVLLFPIFFFVLQFHFQGVMMRERLSFLCLKSLFKISIERYLFIYFF